MAAATKTETTFNRVLPAEIIEFGLRAVGSPHITGIHPAADMWPMMTDDEFEEMCTDAAIHGIRTPICVTPDGVLFDGRNRLQVAYATRQPIPINTFTPAPPEFPDDDPIKDPVAAYVFSANLERHHMTTGQRAMLAERLATAPHGGKIYKTAIDVSIETSIPVLTREQAADRMHTSAVSISRARLVREWAPTLADQVFNGTLSLDAAYNTANDARKRDEARKRAEAETDPAPDPDPEPEPEPHSPEPVITIISDPAPPPPPTPGKSKGKRTTPPPPSEDIELECLPASSPSKTPILVPYPKPRSRPIFNSTTAGQIDWADYSWNPVTGCKHGCTYCYARDIATSKRAATTYPRGFDPLFHHERLPAPSNTKFPDAATRADRPEAGRVFVCSMADLFGEWVPAHWIDSVFNAALAAPHWEYLFLTKFPQRYRRIDLPPVCWFGASVDTQKRVKLTEKAMTAPGMDAVKVRWLSVEPLLEPLTFTDLSWCDLLVIGAQTGTRQPPDAPAPGTQEPVAPQLDWVFDLVSQARAAGTPVYLKDNLMPKGNWDAPGMILPRELPRIRET